MKYLITSLILSLMLINVNAQCSKMGGANVRETFERTNNSQVNEWFSSKCTEIENIFDVNPVFAFYNEGNKSENAMATRDGNIFFGVKMLSKFFNQKAALLGILAHEYAHILQNEEECELTGKYRELHADLIAGYYLAAKGYVLGSDEVETYINVFNTLGDYEFNDPDHHGTPAQREKSAKKGYYYYGMRDDIDEVYEESINFIKNNF